MNLARSASCCAICFCSTACVKSLPNVMCVCECAEGKRREGGKGQCERSTERTKRGERERTHERHVLEDDVELAGALEQVLADAGRDDLALGDELGGVKLGDGRLEDLVADRWQDALVVGGAERAVDGGEVANVGAEHDTQRERHGLQILGARRRRDVLRAGVLRVSFVRSRVRSRRSVR